MSITTTLLGTGSSNPSPDRAGLATLISTGEGPGGEHYLVDAGSRGPDATRSGPTPRAARCVFTTSMKAQQMVQSCSRCTANPRGATSTAR